jgi:hypothetical protein
MEDFLSRYPAAHREELRHRIRQMDDMAHLAAFFELAIHEFLLRAGCQILEVEPAIEGTAKFLDFLVRDAAGNDFFVEATLAVGTSREDAAAERRLQEAYTAIDSVKSPDFLPSVETAGAPEQPVSLRKLRSRLERWLRTLNYDEVAAAWQAQLSVPRFSLFFARHLAQAERLCCVVFPPSCRLSRRRMRG